MKYAFVKDTFEKSFIGKPVPEYIPAHDLINDYFTFSYDTTDFYEHDYDLLDDAKNAFQAAIKACSTFVYSTMVSKILYADILILEAIDDDENAEILDVYAADLLRPSADLIDFVDNLIREESLRNKPEPMTVQDAAYNLDQYAADPDSYDIPDGLTPELFAAVWNDRI